MSAKILVIGSTNTDMVIKSEKFPHPGETILGGKFFMNPGGKGANQAVAAVRLGGAVTFITKTGNDIFGKTVLQQFQKEGININFVIADKDNPSGVALITVDGKGENSIVVAPGANAALNPFDITNAAEEFLKADIILLQLEIPIETVAFCVKLGLQHNKKVIINPAPAMVLSDETLSGLTCITPNKSETEILTGVKVIDIKTAEKAAKILQKKGVKNIVITLGSQGAYLLNDTTSKLFPAPKVNPLDTTAAGDVFNGALAVGISEGMNIEEAIEFANQAAAISVTKMGAQASAPFRKEIKTEKV